MVRASRLRFASSRWCLLVAVAAAGLATPACGSSGRTGYEEGAASATDPSGAGRLGDPSADAGTGGPIEACAGQSVQANRAEVDIIVVIDTSGSMGEETAQVQANINTFAQKIGQSGLDYTVTMIAERPPFGIPLPVGICVPPPLAGANCADNPPRFHHIGDDVDSWNSLLKILEHYPTYEKWLRPSAYKVFIEVTDDNSLLMSWSDFDAQLLAKSPAQFGTASARRYIFNSICGYKNGTPALSPDKCGSAENTGDQYQHLSQLTGGAIAPVCETDYSVVFDNIAKGLITRLGCEFAFPTATGGQQADPAAIVVNYTPSGGAPKALTQVTDAAKCGTVADAWYYDNNAKPSRIIFCESTCATAGADTGGKLDIAVGCKAPPPK